jgi:hypothetical protein
VAADARLLDPCEQEDAIVGRESEDGCEQQQQLRRLEAALALVAEDAFEPSVLEDHDEHPEHGADAERVHEYLRERQDQRPCHDEQHGDRDRGDEPDRERQVVS